MGCVRGPGTEASTTSVLSLRLAERAAYPNLERRPGSRKLAIVSRRDAVGFYHPCSARPRFTLRKDRFARARTRSEQRLRPAPRSSFRGMPANPLGHSNKGGRPLI